MPTKQCLQSNPQGNPASVKVILIISEHCENLYEQSLLSCFDLQTIEV